MTDLGARFERYLFAPLDIAWLAAFRALFGLTLCVSMLRFVAYGWVDELFVKPRFHFKYWGLGWVEVLSSANMHALFWALAALALCVAAGFLYRLSLALFALAFAYLQAVDVSNYLNHYYLALLLALLLLASPAHRAASLDVWLGIAEPKHHVARAWLYLMRFQVGVVYTFAGWAKAHSDWLIHAEPLGIWLGGRSDLPFLGALVSLPHAALIMSWAGFLFDTSIVWLLSWSRTRVAAYAAVLLFHLVTRLLFPIGMFPVIMVLAALVFFPPSWPRVLVGRFRASALADAAPVSSPLPSGRARALLVLALLYCAIQLGLPLRFLIYDGNVRWHEQGMRFSWRVMVREKNGSVTFVVRQKGSGRTFHVSPRRYLTRIQEREMSGQPDLIWQLAQHVRADFAQRGFGDVEVRADAWVSLNGRAKARLIDPDVDLTNERDGLEKAPWILEAPQEPPPELRAVPRIAALKS
jgi:hypothetical protein